MSVETWGLAIGIAGVIVAIVGVIVTVIVTLRVRNRKDLLFEVVSDVPVVSVHEETKEDIEIRYKGKSVTDVRLVVWRLRNTGNVEIRPEDYITPIEVRFGGIHLDTQVLQTVPPDLKDVIVGSAGMQDWTVITFGKVLLNPKDSITCRSLLSNLHGDITVTGRVAGVSSIRQVRKTGWDAALDGAVEAASVTAKLFLFSFFPFSAVIQRVMAEMDDSKSRRS